MESAQDFWQPYEPSAAAVWDRRRAVHLHRRAGFAATWSELERDLAGSPQDAVTRLLAGQSRIDGAPSDFDAMATTLAEAAIGSQVDARLKAAWVYRMFFSPDPLGERLTLTWHNHFATSNRKVQDARKMWQQNDALRRNARGQFDTLLPAAVRSPAMLLWLDADKNNAAHPNENLARELMELFTLGLGQFSEADVQQAARALTGWKVSADEFRFDQARHDSGEKTILGKTGNFDGGQLLGLLSAQPATARRVAWRLARMLMGEGTIDEAALGALAEGLREHDLDVGWGVETILRSQRFFAAENLSAKIIGPAEYVVGSVRALECFSPPASTMLMADWMARMGQDLFYPPNVGGWPEGRAWLASGAIVARANFAAALVEGRLTQSGTPPALEALVTRHAGRVDTRGAIEWFGELLYGGLPTQVIDDIERQVERKSTPPMQPVAAAVLMLLVRPEAHLG